MTGRVSYVTELITVVNMFYSNAPGVSITRLFSSLSQIVRQTRAVCLEKFQVEVTESGKPISLLIY